MANKTYFIEIWNNMGVVETINRHDNIEALFEEIEGLLKDGIIFVVYEAIGLLDMS